jgi:biotin transport system substrate-specific component
MIKLSNDIKTGDHHMKIREMTLVAVFAAVMGSFGLIPSIALSFTPVPLTLQTMGVLLSGGILGARLGFMSQAVFLLLVAAGVPLLSGGRGGLGVFVGPSGGYIISWAVTAFVIGYVLSLFKKVKFHHVLLVNLTVGIFLIYLIGIPVQAMVMGISMMDTVKVSLAYIPGDIIKAVVGSILVYKLRTHPVIMRSLGSLKRTGNLSKTA